MPAGIKSIPLKIILRKLSLGDFDTPKGKKKLCEIHSFLMLPPVEKNIKNHLMIQNFLNFHFHLHR